jgi:hypothetical protein
MAASFVAQRASQHNAAALSTAVTITAGTTGNLLVVLYVTAAASATINAVTDNGTGSAWQNDVKVNPLNARTGILLASTIIGATPPTQVTVGQSVSLASAVKIMEFSGIAATSWFDLGTSTVQSATTAATAGPISPTASGELIVAGWSSAAAQSSFTAGTGYTASGTPTNTAGPDIAAEYKLSGTTSETATGTFSATLTTAAEGAIGAYKAAATEHWLTATGFGH